mgnify:CR=1 FL=1
MLRIKPSCEIKNEYNITYVKNGKFVWQSLITFSREHPLLANLTNSKSHFNQAK